MKEARIERQRDKMLKPQLLSEKKCLEKKTKCSWRNIQRCWCQKWCSINLKNTHQQKNPYHQTLKKEKFLQT